MRSALAAGFTLDELARIFKVRNQGGAPCRQVRALAAAKLDEMEIIISEMTAMRDKLRELLQDWDARLEQTPENERAGLLEALADTNAATRESSSPLTPPWLKRKKRKKEIAQ